MDRVYLKRASDQQVIAVPITRLSSEDQILARKLGTPALGDSSGPAPTPSFANKTAGGTLTEEEEKSLKKEWTDEKTNRRYRLEASFGPRTLEGREKKMVARTGRIPVRLLAYFYEVKKSGGKDVFVQEPGSAHIYIQDAEGGLVDKKTMSFNKLCPT